MSQLATRRPPIHMGPETIRLTCTSKQHTMVPQQLGSHISEFRNGISIVEVGIQVAKIT